MVKEGLIIKEEQIYVLEEELKRKVIHLYHNTLIKGHGGR